MTHGQCDARPTLTEHHRPLAGTKLYCLMTEAHVCEQLAQGRYVKAERQGVEPETYWLQVESPNYYTSTSHN